MNIMRKLWVSGSNPGGNNGGGNNLSGSGSGMNQSISLGLMHLRKLFGDYTHAPSEDKIYNMLPLFCKVTPLFVAYEVEFILHNSWSCE